MTAEIHSIAAVVDGLGNAANLSVGLDDDGMMSDRLRSSSAAVRPAGPAPAMTAICLSPEAMVIVFKPRGAGRKEIDGARQNSRRK